MVDRSRRELNVVSVPLSHRRRGWPILMVTRWYPCLSAMLGQFCSIVFISCIFAVLDAEFQRESMVTSQDVI